MEYLIKSNAFNRKKKKKKGGGGKNFLSSQIFINLKKIYFCNSYIKNLKKTLFF